MASRMVVEKIPLKLIQRYHHGLINHFGEHETLVEAVTNRPGIFGPNPVAYLSIIARRPSVQMGDLDEALLNDRSLIRATAFRSSLFLLSSNDLPIYFRALYPVLKSSAFTKLAEINISEAAFNRMGRILTQADFNTPQTHEQIIDIIYATRKKVPDKNNQRLLVRKFCDLGILARAHTKGWKGNEFSYVLLKSWLAESPLTFENPEGARTEMIRRYLRCYGPATMEDMAWWTGLPLMQVQRSVAHLRREAVRIPLEGHKDDHYGLKETIDNMRNPAEVREEILFLPPWDPFIFGWKNHRRLIDKENIKWVYDPLGNAAGTIVDNGKIIGVWQFRDSKTNIFEFHVFSAYQNRCRNVFNRAEEYSLLLANLSGATAVNIFERPLPAALSERPIGSFLWPLGKEPPFKTPDKTLLESPMERRTANTFRGKYLDSEHVVRG